MLVSFAWVFDSQNTFVTIFTDAQPSVVVGGNKGQSAGHVCGLPAGSWEWIGGNSASTIAEWYLICHRKFLAAIPTSLFFIGSIIGFAFHGRLTDVWLVRKKTLLLACILTSTTTFLTSLAPNIWVYSLLRFANGFAHSGNGICCLVLSTEVVGRKWQGQVGQYGFFFFTAGFLSLPFIAYHTRTYWRYLYRIISLPPLVYAFLVVPLVSESPRWLIVRRKNKEALEVLQKFTRWNGNEMPDNIVLIIPSQATIEKNQCYQGMRLNTSVPYTFTLLQPMQTMTQEALHWLLLIFGLLGFDTPCARIKYQGLTYWLLLKLEFLRTFLQYV
ncbi:hypothetical protein Gotur_012528 [Gossypium turneri]